MKERGSIGVLIAGAVVVLSILAASMALSAVKSEDAALTMIAVRENALKTDNVIRLLDKATAEAACNESSAAQYYNTVIQSVDEPPFGCQIRVDTATQTSTTGELTCITAIGNKEITDTRQFDFSKNRVENPPGNCTATDTVSGCQEYPAFSC